MVKFNGLNLTNIPGCSTHSQGAPRSIFAHQTQSFLDAKSGKTRY
jgi:hypothetical protein